MIKLAIIRRLPGGKYRLYSKKKDKHTGHRKNLGTFDTLDACKKHEKQIQFFKHRFHAEDGACDDNETKALQRISDIAEYLTEAGFIDEADKIYAVMDCLDAGLDKGDDCYDPLQSTIYNDRQNNVDGGYGSAGDGSVAGGAPSWGLDVGTRGSFIASLIKLADRLDVVGAVEEANEIDDMLKIIKELEEEADTVDLDKERNKEEPKQGEEVVTRSTGFRGTNLTDNQNTPSCGFSDSYFYQGNGTVESNL